MRIEKYVRRVVSQHLRVDQTNQKLLLILLTQFLGFCLEHRLQLHNFLFYDTILFLLRLALPDRFDQLRELFREMTTAHLFIKNVLVSKNLTPPMIFNSRICIYIYIY
jgi:hypothetical protein